MNGSLQTDSTALETTGSSRRRTSLASGPLGVRIGLAAVTAALLWSYYEPMTALVARWWNDPDYTHGFLVPAFAGYLLWRRRAMLSWPEAQGNWWGVALILLAAAARLASVHYYYALLDCLSLIPCLAGIALFVGGRKALRWAWPALVMLVFMMPLPGAVAGALSHPLQRTATVASTYLLQTMGVLAVAQGKTIALSETQLGVVEACSGLSMIVLFLGVCTGGAMVVRRPPLDKAIIVLSAAPNALIANVFRITLTGVLYETVNRSLADAVAHDFARWLMMPAAVILLWAELALLSRLLLPPQAVRPIRVQTAEQPAPARRTPPAVQRQQQRRR